MGSIVSVNPFRCRMWALHDRLESAVNEETCKAEIQSFMKHGQLVPVLGRPISGGGDIDVELIYGARRLFVAQHLNCPIKVEMRELTDLDAAIAMDIENRQRKDISPYEHGVCYARWLRAKFFNSQEEIARALKISPSQVSRMLRLAKLPAVLVAAFESPADICEGWGLELMEIWEDPVRRTTIAERARAIAARNSRPPAREVFRLLISSKTQGGSSRSYARDEVITDDNNRALFRVRRQRRWVAVLLPIERVSNVLLSQIRAQITEAIQRDTLQVDSVALKGPGRPGLSVSSAKEGPVSLEKAMPLSDPF